MVDPELGAGWFLIAVRDGMGEASDFLLKKTNKQISKPTNHVTVPKGTLS